MSKRKPRRRFERLTELLRKMHPDAADPKHLIASGRVLVGGSVVTNPNSMVRTGTSIVVTKPTLLRGEAKLRAALAAFGIQVEGRVALDVGAAAGGFTRVLLEAGAERVYAVDAGHGQLLGSLRCHPRVVNLEATNLAELNRKLVPDVIGVVTIDLSYLPLARAVPQLSMLKFADSADLIALVKPAFELQLAEPPGDARSLSEAPERAAGGLHAAGWKVEHLIESAITGAHGAIEFFLHGSRR